MNADTVNLLNRPYQQVVDDILTAMVGGVVNEQIFFDINENRYRLAKPASAIRSITGTLTVRPPGHVPVVNQHEFQNVIDYLFSEADNSIVWVVGGLKPDDQSNFFVDYFRRDAASVSPLNDLNVGSVTRTLSEAVGREITIVYEQINEAYLSGFVDTAKGVALDLVVSILGVLRKGAEFAVGLVTFFRDPAAGSGSITIPQGTELRTPAGIVFETSSAGMLQLGQARSDVPVRAGEASRGPAGKVKAGEINILEHPIAGIARVTNIDPTVLGARPESDDQLRARAKATLQGLGKGTIAALARAVFDEGAVLDQISDPNSPGSSLTPGTVLLRVDTEPERFLSLNAHINETRAAGVLATAVARYVFFKPRLIVTAGGLNAAGKIKLVNQIIAAVQAFVDTLKAGQPLQGQQVLAAIIEKVPQIKGAKAIRFADIIASRSDVANPVPDTLVNALVKVVQATPPGDIAALRVAIADTISPGFSERRIPDRSLVQGPTGARATDQQIADGQFKVVPVVGTAKFSMALDLQPPDIVVVEP